MRTLALDTSGAACSIALIEAGGIVAERHEIVGRGHAERLIPWIAHLPGGGRADRILVGCGPGSFTGVRIAIAAARALGLGWGVPVAGVSSLALVAANIDGDRCVVAIEAGHGEIFLQHFGGAPLQALDDVRSLPLEAAAREATGAIICGSAAGRLVAARGWGEARAGEARAAHALLLPEALTMLPPQPIYGRGPDARPMA